MVPIWTPEHTEIVKGDMKHLEDNCFLKLPLYDRPFHIAADYYRTGIGGVLM